MLETRLDLHPALRFAAEVEDGCCATFASAERLAEHAGTPCPPDTLRAAGRFCTWLRDATAAGLASKFAGRALLATLLLPAAASDRNRHPDPAGGPKPRPRFRLALPALGAVLPDRPACAVRVKLGAPISCKVAVAQQWAELYEHSFRHASFTVDPHISALCTAC